jgi:hypothetical protein
MRPPKHVQTTQADLFRARLDQLVNSGHELVRLAALIDWRYFTDDYLCVD